MSAVEASYRCVDAAETCGFSIADLAAACTGGGLARKDYKVVHKIGHGSTRAPLDDVIGEALASPRYIDVVELRHMVMLQDSVQTVRQERLAGCHRRRREAHRQ